MQVITFFTAGSVPTAAELLDIAKLKTLTEVSFEVRVANGAESNAYWGGDKDSDYVAGTLNAPYDSGYTEADPDALPDPVLPAYKATVSNGDVLNDSVSGTIAVSVTDNVATYTYSS